MDETAACMVVAEDINVMLLTHEKFKVFTPKDICDATKARKFSSPCPAKAEQTSMNWFEKLSGGSTYNDPQDHGFMYGHGFQDPDGHIWELFYMEALAASQG